ncbi:MAG: phytanoyl-CoA dioxygenase family protein [Actinomycetes bacterium]
MNRQILRHRGADRRLKRDGFVKVPFLSPSDAFRVRELFVQLRGLDGEGFATDFTVPDRTYRRRVANTISAALDEPVKGLFIDHQPFLRNFLCKYPGASSVVDLHRDWMYVDERTGARTYTIWIALEDVVGDNGQLRALRGSHRFDTMLRGTNLIAPWLQHTDVIEERLLTIPTSAGEAVIFDNALLHSSYPNFTEVPRVAAALALHHVDDSLVHFLRTGDDEAVRYDITEDFFLDELPQELLFTPPNLPVRETVPVVAADLSADEVAALADGAPRASFDRFYRQRSRQSVDA